MGHEKEYMCLISSRIGCTKFCKGCTKVVKVCSKVENDLQSLPEGFQRKKWIMKREIGIPLAQGLDVSTFLADVPRVPKPVLA